MWSHLADRKHSTQLLSPYLPCFSAASDTTSTVLLSGLPLASRSAALAVCLLFLSMALDPSSPGDVGPSGLSLGVPPVLSFPWAGFDSYQCASDSNVYHSPEHLSGDPLASGAQWRSHNCCKLGISQNELLPPPNLFSLHLSEWHCHPRDCLR